jgi:hypothetical protein
MLDVEIYMKNIIRFFKQNPKDLLNLIPGSKEDEFYDKIRESAIKNTEKGECVSLTQDQFVNICIVLNGKDPITDRKIKGHFITTSYGIICLN